MSSSQSDEDVVDEVVAVVEAVCCFNLEFGRGEKWVEWVPNCSQVLDGGVVAKTWYLRLAMGKLCNSRWVL